MTNQCLRCGYLWAPRSGNPVRCPQCKSTKWNTEHISHVCQRCGFTWNQRGESLPRYCPSCHSAMWNEVKVTYTCPKCGRTRVLRSNSRVDMCPFCDEYGDSKQPVSESDHIANGLTRPTVVWSDGKGIVMIYNNNGSGNATVYEDGELVATTNLDFWFRTHNYTPERALENLKDQTMKDEIAILVKQLYGSRSSYHSKAQKIRSVRAVTPLESEVIALKDSGMSPVAISMKLKLPFAEVMNILEGIPPMQAPARYDSERRGGSPRTDSRTDGSAGMTQEE